MRIICVELFRFWTSGSRDVAFRYLFFFNSINHFFQLSLTIYAISVEYEQHLCEIILNLDKWLRRRCHIKIFLFLAAKLFGVAERFVQY